ncbi:MAG: kelch motif-containing protein [Planctomycetes bacterium]|nr:kelch motif-containing protein [Planctomycetota bacterium]
MKKSTTTRLVASTLASTLVAGLATATAGCNTGSSGGGKAFFGPGSTGANPGATPGPGGGGGGGLGTFSSAPALGAPRAQQTATTLPDGRVLVTGGTDGNGTYQTSEIFDPVANAWTPLDQLAPTPADAAMNHNGFATARQLHTATLLGNGRVLIAGGLGVEVQNQFAALTTCFLFEPTTNTFTQTGAMPQGRGWHLATLLSNGEVLVAGGVDAQLSTVTPSATYNPTTGQWTASGNSAARSFGAMVTVGGQTVIVGGCELGQNNGQLAITGLPNPIVERYDVQARTFGQGPTNVGHRLYYSAAVSSGGRALFAGGQGVNGQNLALADTTEYYDPQQNDFVQGPQLNEGRDSAEIAEIGGSADMLIVGGLDDQGGPMASAEIYQFTTNTIVGTTNMANPRVDHKVVTLLDGRILVIGGADANGNSIDSCEFYTR